MTFRTAAILATVAAALLACGVGALVGLYWPRR